VVERPAEDVNIREAGVCYWIKHAWRVCFGDGEDDQEEIHMGRWDKEGRTGLWWAESVVRGFTFKEQEGNGVLCDLPLLSKNVVKLSYGPFTKVRCLCH
jgi:hypothetical protein